MNEKKRSKKKPRLDDFMSMLRVSFCEGYQQGAVAVAKGSVVVEKTDKGYLLKGGSDVSAGATREC